MKEEKKFEAYCDIEEHVEGSIAYEKTQFIIRNLAITCIIGNFASIGYVFKIEASHLPFSYTTCCIFICLASLLINFVLMLLDLSKEEKLSTSFFYSALEIEKSNQWMPKLYTEMKNLEGRRHAAMEKKVHFYTDIGRDLVLIAALGIIFPMFRNGQYKNVIFLALIAASIIFLYGWSLKKLFSKIEDFNDKLLSK